MAEPSGWAVSAAIARAELEIPPDIDPRTWKPLANALREVARQMDALDLRLRELEARREVRS